MSRQLFYYSVVFLLTVSVILPACKDKDDNFTINYEYDYFPTDSGHYIIYDVDSIKFTAQKSGSTGYVQTNDTVKYQLMEFYAGDFFDSMQGILKYRIEYYKRANSSAAWQQDRVWWATRTTTNIQRQEDDLKFVKLIFPPRENAEWNGTAFIPKTGLNTFLDGWKFKMTEVGTSKNIGTFSFEKTIHVTHTEDGKNNLIEYQHSSETYAKGVGIVYKAWDKIEKQDVLSGWDNPQNANGFKIRMSVVDYFPR